MNDVRERDRFDGLQPLRLRAHPIGKEDGDEDVQSQHRSEFRYGTFTRHIALPVTADANDIKANYHWGILQVSIGLRGEDEDEAGRRIPVQTTAS